MVKDGLVSDVFSYNMPIDCFCKANVMNEAAKAFKVMQDRGKADEDGPQTGTGIAGGMPQTGTGIVDADPAEVVAKALLCFNNKSVSGILILSTHGRIRAVEYVEICSINHRCFTQ
ncbi:uncharacterized protein LOC133696955 isoform X1 [Populus nigra]|uniref:uncharacterized protein LOC133696955 isoform X1 n=1 Tax=Populus nigra TaxID=3691 RepID=UPI002B278DE7|nr:uncharacterized protein LOC133696955 isoform X1 [Populus nigra]